MSEQAAIIVIDDNNDFLSEGGKLYPAVQDFLSRHGTVDAINRVLAAARTSGVTVIRVAMGIPKGAWDQMPEPYGILATVKETGAFEAGTWGAEVSDAISGGPADIEVHGKATIDAFASTNLGEVLDQHEIKKIALCGLLSNLCIESTMRTAYDRGLDVYTLTDASAALTDAHHDSAVANDWPLLSKPVTAQAFFEKSIAS